MRILFINEVCGHTSTGKICAELAEKYAADGHEVKIAFGRDNYAPEKYRRFAVRIGTDWDVRIHAIYTRLTDRHGLGSIRATRKFLNWAEEFNPDLVWLHNLHGYYINYEMLFAWLKRRPQMKVKWTLHDCWAFTGHCSHFTYVKCDKWKNGCHDCPQRRSYPASIVDNSKKNYEQKKKAFSGINNLTILTPSEWLADRVRLSFLNEYIVKVEHNQVDSTVFKPTSSDFRNRYGLENKIVILGVANVWNERKGLNDFIKLSQMLDERFAVVLVGLNNRQIRALSKRVIGISKTKDQIELAGIYTAADVLVVPSYEETFGMTVLEARKCDTNAIVYEDTACEEIVRTYGGFVVKQGPEYIYEKLIEQFN